MDLGEEWIWPFHFVVKAMAVDVSNGSVNNFSRFLCPLKTKKKRSWRCQWSHLALFNQTYVKRKWKYTWNKRPEIQFTLISFAQKSILNIDSGKGRKFGMTTAKKTPRTGLRTLFFSPPLSNSLFQSCSGQSNPLKRKWIPMKNQLANSLFEANQSPSNRIPIWFSFLFLEPYWAMRLSGKKLYWNWKREIARNTRTLGLVNLLEIQAILNCIVWPIHFGYRSHKA